MADRPTPHYDDVRSAIRGLVAAHVAVQEGIATHAEKHEHTLHQARQKRAADLKLQEGMAQYGASVQAIGH